MILKKWNWKKKIYEPVEISNNLKVSSYESDMNTIINCPHCSQKIRYGESYTSREFHNDLGLGYGVCEKCYEEEINREKEAKNEL
jgi:superfamily II helicase